MIVSWSKGSNKLCVTAEMKGCGHKHERSAFLSSEGFDTGIKCLRDLITLGSNKMEIAAEAVAETEKVVTIAGIFRFYKDVVMDASPSC